MSDSRPGSGVTTAEQPRPYRLSDAERSEAVNALADAFAEGRLDGAEFEERMGAASQARFASQLDPLFADLPPARRSWREAAVLAVPPSPPADLGRAPGTPPGSRVPPRSARGPEYDYPAPFAFVPLIVLVVLTTHLWFLLPLAFMTLSMAGNGFTRHGPRPCSGPAAARRVPRRGRH